MKPKGDVAAEPENKTEAPKPAFRPTMKSRTPETTGIAETTDAPKPVFRPTTIKPKGAGTPGKTLETSNPAFRPTADFSVSQPGSRPAFRPQSVTENDHSPATPTNTKFSPAGYKPLKSAARPSFGMKLPPALIAPQQPVADRPETESKQAASAPETPAAPVQPADRPKAAFRPTMKPKK